MAENTQKTDALQAALDAIAPKAGQVVRWDTSAQDVTDANFEYADLVKGSQLARTVRAVVEKDGSALMYVATATTDDATDGQALARLLGNRGETALLLQVHRSDDDGKLRGRVWPCAFDADASTTVDLENPFEAASVLGDLQEGLWSAGEAYQEQRLRDLLVSSISKVRAEFLNAPGIGAERSREVLALVGRALFTRFLIDRKILTLTTAPVLWGKMGQDGELAFATPTNAAAVCQWLDDTFNGEFLPLPAGRSYRNYFDALVKEAPEALSPLGWICAKTDAGGQLPMWDRLDFSYIPVGTLSEVYEDYVHEQSPTEARAKSVHYTPRHLVRMMVRQAMAGLPADRAASATVLDPAVGAAVFLSLAFRELARLRAKRDGIWPETSTLRHILYKQLRGMDVNGSALNLAALTLYLTAIELDANPVPPEKLRFHHRLVGTVLLHVGGNDDKELHASVLGSLRTRTGLDAQFDVVIGNPPWTSLKPNGGAPVDLLTMPNKDLPGTVFTDRATEIARRCITERLGPQAAAAYTHPDRVPDLAFLWKAMEWAKPEGIITLVVHQRLLTKRSDSWSSARQTLLRCVQVDGILDASEFPNHKPLFWPTIEAPCCVLFAKNRLPSVGHSSLLMTLTVEPVLQTRRQLRLDPCNTFRVSPEDFEQAPAGVIPRLKGCELDAALLERWNERCVSAPTARPDTPIRRLPLGTIGREIAEFAIGDVMRGVKKGDRGAKVVTWLQELPESTRFIDVKRKDRQGGLLRITDLHDTYQAGPVKSHPRQEHIVPPMLLLHQGGGDYGDLRRVNLIEPDSQRTRVMFPFAFFGAPFPDTPEAWLRAKYVALWANSCVASYYATLTSTQFGFGIKALLNEDLLNVPILPFDTANARGLIDEEFIEVMFDKLRQPSETQANTIDKWACSLLGLDTHENQLIQDTLSVSYPVGNGRRSGRAWVTNSQVVRYAQQLALELEEAADRIDVRAICALPPYELLKGWCFIFLPLHERGHRFDAVDPQYLVTKVREAYPSGQVWLDTDDGFVFGQMALLRNWLPSRACLVATNMLARIEE